MWIARDKDNILYLYYRKPLRNKKGWWVKDNGDFSTGKYDYLNDNTIPIKNTDFRLPESMFPNLTWENEPIEVDLVPTQKMFQQDYYSTNTHIDNIEGD